jgi:hypothetical protein
VGRGRRQPEEGVLNLGARPSVTTELGIGLLAT